MIDASIMPRMISANLNASIMMIADKASDLMRGRKLPEAAAGSNAGKGRGLMLTPLRGADLNARN